ncbi:MAG: protoporphyrinogen/coproporphyrinogen oxidase [Phycisphaeraceae bacterium]
MDDDVVIVGAGLAGLCCARRLSQAGLRSLLLDAADAVGGRVRTDDVEGFRLDRGFQVFSTAYPEAQQVLDDQALDLHRFEPGALVRYGGALHPLTDPWRRPLRGLRSVFSPIGTFADKLRVARLRSRVLRGSVADQFVGPETTTLEALQQDGFTDSMIERFFRPFLGGIFLDPELNASSRMFNFVFRMFSSGHAALPAQGMQAIPRQIALGLRPGSIRLNTRVIGLQNGSVRVESGESIRARAVVVATESPIAAELLGEAVSPGSQGVTCLYFATDRPPIDRPILVLNGEGHGPVNNLCVPSLLVPCAPEGRHLVSATVLGIPAQDDATLERGVREQLAGWFGAEVNRWQHLRTYRIPHALPRQAPPALSTPERPVRWRDGLYVCGDHRDNASINGAMVSGRRAAEALLADLGN